MPAVSSEAVGLIDVVGYRKGGEGAIVSPSTSPLCIEKIRLKGPLCVAEVSLTSVAL